MKLDAGLSTVLSEVPARVVDLERRGYDGAIVTETNHDPFLPLALAAEHSERIELMTSIAVAFARSPLTLAHVAHDLNAFSRGRFVLGLGSQVRAHITRRFSMPWSAPARRMHEFIRAMRAIWRSWYAGEPLDFQGEFYSHTLMTPVFSPHDTQYGAPRVFLAAVGPRMTEVAAEVADGVIAHAFTTQRYLREVTLPAVARGLARAGKRREDFTICAPLLIGLRLGAPGEREQLEGLRRQIAFYGSTPAYRGVLEQHGWGELQPRLHELSRRGQWAEMGTLIGDDVLREFAVLGSPAEVVEQLRARSAGVLDRLVLDTRGAPPEVEAELRAELAAG
jgi:probable F420-dependent oxidoreductase